MKFWCVIPAAGSGTRFQSDIPKQFLSLAGHSLVSFVCQRILNHPNLAGLVLVLPGEAQLPDDLPQDPRLHHCVGGETRRDSVLAGCQYLSGIAEADDVVLVHDAARPLILMRDIDALLVQLQQSPAYLVAPVADTLRHRDGSALDRDSVWRVLTPQGARLGQLCTALLQADVLTDEVAYLQRIGLDPVAVPGSSDNQKITWPGDLRWAESLLETLD